jgi:hypothetical protein
MTLDEQHRLAELRRKHRSQKKWSGAETDVAFLLRLLDAPRGKYGQFLLSADDLEADRQQRRERLRRPGDAEAQEGTE